MTESCKSERRGDMKMRAKKVIAILTACVLLLAGCGNSNEGTSVIQSDDVQGSSVQGSQNAVDVNSDNNIGMGRYVEEEINLQAAEDFYPTGLGYEDGVVRLANIKGIDRISTDGGKSFSMDANPLKTFTEKLANGDYFHAIKTAPDGSRIVSAYKMDEGGENGTFINFLITAEDEEIELPEFDGIPIQTYYGNDGYFYAYISRDQNIYRIDAATGEVSHLFQTVEHALYMAVCGNYLYVSTSDGKIQIFDLDKKEEAEEDTVLSEFLKDDFSNYYSGELSGFLISQAPDREGMYVLTEKGLYYHILYGNVMEQVIDGSLCSIGNITKGFVDLAVVKEGTEDVFLILYSDSTLSRFAYDPEVPAIPANTLRIYSMYEDTNIRMAISAYQQNNPDVYVKYEIGISESSGVTREDALIQLSTEIASGNGPDVLLMDHIPYESYVEKGVLMDLSDIWQEMKSKEGYFEAVISNYESDKGIYTIPMVFSLPILTGEAKAIEGAETLSDFADLLETLRTAKSEGKIMDNTEASDLLTLLSMASSGTWVQADGSLDKGAVTEYLTDCRRIYETLNSGVSDLDEENEIHRTTSWGTSGMGPYSEWGAIIALVQNRYMSLTTSAGIFSGTVGNFSYYLSMLKAYELDYTLLPGQNQGACTTGSLLAVNAASGMAEEAVKFLQYALSAEYQGKTALSAVSVNRDAYIASMECPYETDEDGVYSVIASSDSDGGVIETLYIAWLNEDEKAQVLALLDSITKVNTCDDRILQSVVEYGAAALTGEKSIEEAVNAIEKNVQLYLAE